MKVRSVFSFVVLGALAAGSFQILPVAASATSTAEDLKFAIDQKTRELDSVTRQLVETQAQLSDVTVRGNTLTAEISRINKNVTNVNLGIKASELTLDKLGLELEAVQQDIELKEKSVVLRQEALANLLQDYQERGQQGFLLAFLDNKSLADALAETQSISDFNNGLLTEVAEIRQLRTALADHLDEVSSKKTSVERERENLRAKRAIVEEQKAQQQQLLAETKNKEANYKKLISELEEKQQEISDQISEIEDLLRAQYGGEALPSKRPGVFIKPIAGAKLTQEYGATKFAQRAYKTKFHNGIDFAASIGTPVLAADEGTIFAVGNNGRVQYGKYIVIRHPNGLSTMYAHLSRQSVAVGDSVKRGDVIGYAGNTGYSTGPHLHFTVYLSSSVQLKSIGGAGVVPVGYTLDPLDYL